MAIWRAGMRCVCFVSFYNDPFGTGAPLPCDVPAKGRVYTIRRVDLCETSGLIALAFVEIDASPLIGMIFHFNGRPARFDGEPGWDSRHFRPLVESRLDQFRAHLVQPPRELVDA